MIIREVTTHIKDLLDINCGDETFALFVKLMKALLVSANHIKVDPITS